MILAFPDSKCHKITSTSSVDQKVMIVASEVSRGFLGILFSAGEFRAGALKDIIVNFEQQFPVIKMYGWHGQWLFTTGKVIIMHLSIVLDIV